MNVSNNLKTQEQLKMLSKNIQYIQHITVTWEKINSRIQIQRKSLPYSLEKL